MVSALRGPHSIWHSEETVTHKGGDGQRALSGLVAVGTQSSQGRGLLNQTVEGSFGKGPHAAPRPGPAPQSERVSRARP